MSFRLEPATIEDVPTLVTIFDEAFAQDAIAGQVFKDVPPELRRERDLKWYSAAIENSESNGARLTKVVDTANGEIAGFSKFDIPHILTAAQKAEKGSGPRNRDSLPQGTNVALYDEFFGQIDQALWKWVDPEKDTYLHILAVRPRYHRRGLGSRLIRSGLEAADAARSKIYIIASPMGLPLYRRLGWEKLDEIVVDMRKYGGSGVVVEELLLRAVGSGC